MRSRPQRPGERKREEYAYVVDVFDAESSVEHRQYTGQIAQLMGEKFFILLEGLVKQGSRLDSLERVYVGSGSRDKIAIILRRIGLDDLTPFGKGELSRAIAECITLNETRWVDILNNMGPITTRLHSLQLLPGIGKKTVWDILNERERKPFRGFNDFQMRTNIDPIKILAERVKEELEGEQKYTIFVDLYQDRS
jgi:putative nucleotide binding protein